MHFVHSFLVPAFICFYAGLGESEAIGPASYAVCSQIWQPEEKPFFLHTCNLVDLGILLGQG